MSRQPMYQYNKDDWPGWINLCVFEFVDPGRLVQLGRPSVDGLGALRAGKRVDTRRRRPSAVGARSLVGRRPTTRAELQQQDVDSVDSADSRVDDERGNVTMQVAAVSTT